MDYGAENYDYGHQQQYDYYGNEIQPTTYWPDNAPEYHHNQSQQQWHYGDQQQQPIMQADGGYQWQQNDQVYQPNTSFKPDESQHDAPIVDAANEARKQSWDNFVKTQETMTNNNVPTSDQLDGTPGADDQAESKATTGDGTRQQHHYQ